MFLTALKDKFKKRSGEKYLRKNLRSYQGPEMAKTGINLVGVIADLDSFEHAESFYKLVDLLDLRPNSVKIMGYRAFYDKNSPYSTPVFSDKDLGWGGDVENSYALEFLSKDYDLLINYYAKDALILKLMTVKSRARIKVGFADVDPDLNDLILQASVADFSTFASELKKYLRVMNEI